MQNLLINNSFSLIGGGFATVRDDVVWRNFRSDDLTDAEPCSSKWPVMVPLFAYHRLYFVTDGYAILKLADGTSLKLEKNKLYLISPFTVRSVQEHASVTHFYIHFKSNTQVINPFEYYHLNNPVDAGEEEYDHFRTLLKNYGRKDLQSELTAQGSLLLLLAKFFPPDAAVSPAMKRFAPVLDYIEEHICSKITVKQLADVLGYNETYFSGLFSKQFNQPPLKYVSEKKMILARRQLALTDMSIKEISDYLGFDNEFYFNTVFRRSVGIPPGKWRKQYFDQHN